MARPALVFGAALALAATMSASALAAPSAGSANSTAAPAASTNRAGFARPAMFANGTWYLRNTVTTTSTVTSFRFGANSQRPVVWTVRLS